MAPKTALESTVTGSLPTSVFGIEGGRAAGCLDCSSSKVFSLRGGTPFDDKSYIDVA